MINSIDFKYVVILGNIPQIDSPITETLTTYITLVVSYFGTIVEWLIFICLFSIRERKARASTNRLVLYADHYIVLEFPQNG